MRTFVIALLCLAPVATLTAAPRPNIVLIMSDDMGYSDIGCYGSEIATPHLDHLASGGLRFTQFYNTGRCCPTRASLLTGLYPHQAGVGHMMDDRGHPGYQGNLNRQCQTIPEVLGPAGYRCYMAGKWHVTKTVRPKNDAGKHNWPRQRGFDRFYGTIHGAGSLFDPNSLTRDNQLIAPADPDNYYYTDAISDNAAQFIREHNDDSPFFLYVAYTAAHWPMHARPADIARYKGRYDKGWDALRQERYQRMQELGLINPAWGLAPNVQDWEQAEEKPWQRRRMEVYAAMIDSMDQGIGRILDSLKAKQQFDNTLVLFLQDNGGCQEEYGSRGKPRPDPALKLPAMKPGELQFKMIPEKTRDGRPVRQGVGVMPGAADTFVAYGIQWANASNTPFREYKHFVHEGGISTPLIAHWPAGITDHNAFRHDPAHLIDIMATCVDLAGANYPRNRNGQEIRPLEGTSLTPAFAGQPLAPRTLYWEHEGNRAVRQGDWKLVAKGRNGPWELYNLKSDRSELKNLAEQHPQRTQSMGQLWTDWARRAHVLPWPDGRQSRKVSRQKKFTLKPTTQLPRDGGLPDVSGRALEVTATVKAGSPGVIVAQGGSAHGYALLIDKQHHLVFCFRRNGKLTRVVSPDRLPDGTLRLGARLDRQGGLQISIAGKVVARGKAAGPLTALPADGLQVGRDTGGSVGNYVTPNPFAGVIERVVIQLP